MAGKLRWSSLECVAGEAISASSDVWSIGVLAYALLFSRTPHGDAATDASIRAALAPAATLWPLFDVSAQTTLPFGLPEGIPALLQQCWQRDPAQRINATDLADSLAALGTTPLLNQPLESPSPSLGYQNMPGSPCSTLFAPRWRLPRRMQRFAPKFTWLLPRAKVLR